MRPQRATSAHTPPVALPLPLPMQREPSPTLGPSALATGVAAAMAAMNSLQQQQQQGGRGSLPGGLPLAPALPLGTGAGNAGAGAVPPLRRLSPAVPQLEGIKAAGFLDKRNYPVSACTIAYLAAWCGGCIAIPWDPAACHVVHAFHAYPEQAEEFTWKL